MVWYLKMVKYKIARYINNISINGKEFILDDKNKIIEFDTIDKAKEYLEEHGITEFEGFDFDEIEEEIVCPRCKGKGIFDDNFGLEVDCPDCFGTGRL